jgi:hypothetical protein
MAMRKMSVLFNLGTCDTWSTTLGNESMGPDGTLRYESRIDGLRPFGFTFQGATDLEKSREFERLMLPLLPDAAPPGGDALPVEVEVMVPVSETAWMPGEALRIATEWLSRIGRPDGRCLVWNVRTDRGPSHGSGVLMWNGHMVMNMTGCAVECLVGGPETGMLNSCPTRIASDGALEIVLENGFLNDVAAVLSNALARDEHARSMTLLLPHPRARVSRPQMQALATSILSQVSMLCFAALGRSLPGSAHTVWNA